MALSRRRERILGRLRRRKTREREGLFLVEGIRSAQEALSQGANLRFAVCSPRLRMLQGGDEVARRLEAAGVEVDWVDDGELDGLSDTETPQGVLLVCVEPTVSLTDLVDGSESPRLLLLDGLQDPGNVGTLVRAAAAFGLTAVLALDGTVDPYNPKAVRAAAGALFHIPLLRAPWETVEGALASAGLAILAADTDGDDVAATPPPPPGWALAVGNEGRGCRDGVRAAAARLVSVPMPGGAESLNAGVAGAVLMYALFRGTSTGGQEA